MNFDNVRLSLKLRLPDQRQAGALQDPARDLGKKLADEVDRFVRAQKLGYYPALEFFSEGGRIEPGLVDAARRMSWHNSKFTRETIEKQLKPIFSTVKIQSIQTSAFNMPPVRPNTPDAFLLLVKHYTPDEVRVDLLLSLMRRENDRRRDGAEVYTRKMMFRWLGEFFDSIEITSSKTLDD